MCVRGLACVRKSKGNAQARIKEDQTNKVEPDGLPCGVFGPFAVTCTSEWGSNLLVMTHQKNLEYSQTTKDSHQARWFLVFKFQSLSSSSSLNFKAHASSRQLLKSLPSTGLPHCPGSYSTEGQSRPGACLLDYLYVPPPLRPEVLQWAHAPNRVAVTWIANQYEMSSIFFLRVHLGRGHKTLGQGLSCLISTQIFSPLWVKSQKLVPMFIH